MITHTVVFVDLQTEQSRLGIPSTATFRISHWLRLVDTSPPRYELVRCRCTPSSHIKSSTSSTLSVVGLLVSFLSSHTSYEQCKQMCQEEDNKIPYTTSSDASSWADQRLTCNDVHHRKSSIDLQFDNAATATADAANAASYASAEHRLEAAATVSMSSRTTASSSSSSSSLSSSKSRRSTKTYASNTCRCKSRKSADSPGTVNDRPKRPLSAYSKFLLYVRIRK